MASKDVPWGVNLKDIENRRNRRTRNLKRVLLLFYEEEEGDGEKWGKDYRGWENWEWEIMWGDRAAENLEGNVQKGSREGRAPITVKCLI